MSLLIDGIRWMNGREACRYVARELGGKGAACICWTDMSEKWPCGVDPRSKDKDGGPVFTFKVMFTCVAYGKKDAFVHMDAVQVNGGSLHVGFSSPVSGNACLPEVVAECLHALVSEDAEPQYAECDIPCGACAMVPQCDVTFVYDEDDPSNGGDPVDAVYDEQWRRSYDELHRLVSGMPLDTFKGVVAMVRGFKEAING